MLLIGVRQPRQFFAEASSISLIGEIFFSDGIGVSDDSCFSFFPGVRKAPF